ncbi:MAG: class I SAM-dependent methyltransferase [Candidatus Saccharicenans sp.]
MHNILHFFLMSLSYKVRDFLWPRRLILKETGIKLGDRVLDFGCGPGSYILPLARMVDSQGEIYALDINPLAVRRIEALAKKNELKNIKTIQSDGPTGIPDDYFDAILLYDLFHDLKNPEAILKELHRVLKPEGTLSFSDHHLKEGQIIKALTSSNLFRLVKKGRFTYSFRKI